MHFVCASRVRWAPGRARLQLRALPLPLLFQDPVPVVVLSSDSAPTIFHRPGLNDGSHSYKYDADGRRVAKNVGGAATDFIYNREGHIILTNPAIPTAIEMYAAGLHPGTYIVLDSTLGNCARQVDADNEPPIGMIDSAMRCAPVRTQKSNIVILQLHCHCAAGRFTPTSSPPPRTE
jgi:hypothetical protein